jgi:hypothetical protein
VSSLDGSFISIENGSFYGTATSAYAFTASTGGIVAAKYSTVNSFEFAFYCSSSTGCIWEDPSSVILGTNVTTYVPSSSSVTATNIITGG